MSKKLVTSYTFTAASKTIASADFTSLEKIQLITNVTANIIIYNFADSTKGGTLASTTLTLAYNTTGMSNTDKLQIFVEDATQAVPITDNGGSLTVDATALPLPTGASTAAKQPALGTAGTPSADVITVQGVTSMTALKTDGSGVTQPVSGTVTASNITGNVADAATDSGNPVKIAGKYNAAMPTYTDGQRGDLQLGSRGALRTTLYGHNTSVQIGNLADNADAVALDTGGNSLKVINRNTVYNGATYDRMRGDTTGTYTVSRASTTGGYTPGKLISAATTNATSVKASAGTIGYISASNINAAARYLKIYNKATAPTVGTDTPVHTFLIPGNTAGAGTNIMLPPQGIALGTGIAFAITAAAADADTTAVAASEIIVNYGWI